ncbi:MAG: hypothetical protein ABEJ70_04595 [Halobacteriaceae archaeon]
MSDATPDSDAPRDERPLDGPSGPPASVRSSVVETPAGRRCTIYEDHVDEAGRMTRWLVAGPGAFVSLDRMR